MSLLTNTMTLAFKLDDACHPENQTSGTTGQEMSYDPFLATYVAAKSNLRVAVIGAPIQYKDAELSSCLIGYHDFSKAKPSAELKQTGTDLAIESQGRTARLCQKRKDQIQLLVANVVNQDGWASTDHVVKALHWVFDQKVDVIYCHLDGDMKSFWLQSILNKISKRGIILMTPQKDQQVPVPLTQMKTKKIVSIESFILHVGETCEGPLVAP